MQAAADRGGQVSYTPEQLRDTAAAMVYMHERGDPAQLRAHADLLERYALLKKHAEAMANGLKGIWDDYECGNELVAAYRADFPAEE